MWAAFLTTILFSISAVAGNRTVKLLGGTVANFYRLAIAAILLGLYAHLGSVGVSGQAFPMFFLSGCIGFGVGDLALFQALPRLGSRLCVMLTLCLSSPLAAVLEWGWMNTTLSPGEIGAGLVTLLGVALALAPQRGAAGDSRTPGEPLARRGILAGVLFGLVAAICQALGAVLSRRAFSVAALAGENIDGPTAAYQRILGGIAVCGLVLLVAQRRVLFQLFTPAAPVSLKHGTGQQARRWSAWPWVAMNALAGPVLGVSCFQWALKTTATGVALPIVALTPVVIIPFSYHLEGERPTLRSLAGGLIAVCGAATLAWVASRKG